MRASNAVGYGVLGALGVFFIFGTFDVNFRQIVTKPDNVPIVGLIFLLAFFVWYSIREGVLNDRRIAAGQADVLVAEQRRAQQGIVLVEVLQQAGQARLGVHRAAGRPGCGRRPWPFPPTPAGCA